MGFGIKELLLVLLIAVVIFGTKRLRNMGGDLGGALRDFRSAMKQSEDDDDKAETDDEATDSAQARVIDQDPAETKRRTEETASHDHTS